MLLPESEWGSRRDELALLEWGEEQVLYAAILHDHGTPAMHALALRLHYRLSWNVIRDWKDDMSDSPQDIDDDVQHAFKENGQMPGMCCFAKAFQDGLCGVSRNSEFGAWLLMRDVTAYDCDLARLRLADTYRFGESHFSTVIYEYLFLETGLPAAAKGLADMFDSWGDDRIHDWRQAAALYEYAVQTADDMHALRNLGKIFWYGREGLPANPMKSIELYEKYERSSQKPICSEAMTELAGRFEVGDFTVPEDPPRAVELYQRSAELDPENIQAITSLGRIFEHGATGVPRDPRRAEACYVRADGLGSYSAKLLLADLLMCEGALPDKFRVQKLCDEWKGDGYVSLLRMFDLARMLNWIDDDLGASRLKAAEYLENALACGDIGYHLDLRERVVKLLGTILIQRGAGLSTNRPRAIRLLELVVREHDSPDAMHSLAKLLTDRRYEEDIPRAIELLEKAIEEGDTEAKITLASILTETRYGPAIDMERGIRLYEEQLRDNDMDALVELAEVLGLRERASVADVSRAIELCERAIAQALRDDREELDRLGIHPTLTLRNGDYVSEVRAHSIRTGFHLFAMCVLGQLLVRKSPEDKNAERALSLFERALKDPNASVTFQVEPTGREWNLEDRMVMDDYYFESQRGLFTLVKEDEELCKKAVRVYELAVGRTGSTKTMCLLGKIFLNGSAGVPRDVKKGLCFYKRAVFKGNTSAMLTLGEIVSTDSEYVCADMKYAFELFTRIIEQEEGGLVWRSAVVNLAMLFESHLRRRKRG